ncbi:MAG: SLBB domain-containing protein, partial [Gemmatimonadetes bacterium]|nr:SLBB domain-containing protein [Gemmatimonadota bacterium]
ESGMTRVEVQQRLRELGYDTSLADPYFDRMEGVDSVGVPEPSADFLQALIEIGMLSPEMLEEREPQDTLDDVPVEEEALEEVDSLAWAFGIPIFGQDIFSRPSSQFQIITTGPVDSDYRLGPGDQLILVITGDVELAYALEVNREGLVVVPDVGQVFVNGRTLAELEDHLFDRLGSVYSGVRRGAGASTFFHVSIGRLRSNLVYVIGEASTPGAYQVSSVATLLNALYVAGGPSTGGSFRSIQVRRDDRVIAEVDLYDYLLGGDAGQDLRLEQGDIIFIPLSGPQVAIRGRVRRSAVFELKAQEDLLDLLRFAGGPLPDAYLERIQIDRILSPDQRLPGFERVLVDVDGNRVLSGEFRFEPRDGDIVEVFGISSERYNRVTIQGDVTYPGTYEYRAGMTLWSLIDRAGGLLPDAFEHRAHILRPIVEDGTVDLIQVSLTHDQDGVPVDDQPLEDLDEVVVYSLSSLLPPRTVSISGLVKIPGSYPFTDGMTAEDLVLVAGGFEEGAQSFEAEVYRR